MSVVTLPGMRRGGGGRLHCPRPGRGGAEGAAVSGSTDFLLFGGRMMAPLPELARVSARTAARGRVLRLEAFPDSPGWWAALLIGRIMEVKRGD